MCQFGRSDTGDSVDFSRQGNVAFIGEFRYRDRWRLCQSEVCKSLLQEKQYRFNMYWSTHHMTRTARYRTPGERQHELRCKQQEQDWVDTGTFFNINRKKRRKGQIEKGINIIAIVQRGGVTEHLWSPLPRRIKRQETIRKFSTHLLIE